MHVPKRIVPTAAFVAPGVSPNHGAAATPQLVNHGGPVLTAVEVVVIYWGADWTAGGDAQLAGQLDAFFDFIVTSQLMDMLAEYGTPAAPIGHGKRLQSVRVSTTEPGDPSAAGRVVTDVQIQTALQGWIADGTIPPESANTLYFLYLPPGVVVEASANSASCTDICGYHDQINGTIYYAVIPYINCSGCVFSGALLDTFTLVSSHELCEAITDPALSTWWDPSTGNEIGDICNRDSVRLGAYLVQTEWSNARGACTILPAG